MDAVYRDKIANFIYLDLTQSLPDIPNVTREVETELNKAGFRTAFQLIGALMTRIDSNVKSGEIAEWFAEEYQMVFDAFNNNDKYIVFIYSLLYKIDINYPGCICFDDVEDDDNM